ncbi:MAG: hypothetical protein IV101_03880 [Dechloromonas sp.]|uniref:phage/plasmid replication protein, II/X family n=1 Tax=Dechloromonas sp. TaxID=1917218 RepID=UPI0027F24C62|nr:phage/plasmid replication protein, II/X family [Dechloromonas sp.]MBT9520012.1 hypothetical protein [Dechloromonas sp.]
MKFSLLSHPDCFQLPDTTVVNVISPDGEILDTFQNRMSVEGRYGVHSLQLRALHKGRELSVEGSPYAYLYGQNLYTSNDLLAALRELLPQVLDQCVTSPADADVQRWMSGDISLARVDLYVNFPCPEGVTAKRFIRQIARQLIERGVATRTFGNTFVWSPDRGRKYEIVFYAKGPQMRAKRSLKHFPERSRLLREAENIVRVELCLQVEMLRQLGLNNASDWTQETPRKIFGKFMRKLGIVNVTAGSLSNQELVALPSDRLKPVLALHKAGYDLRQIYSPATVQRHLHAFRNLGIDLRCPNQLESEVLPLLKLLSPKRAVRGAPKWMRSNGYAPADCKV